MPDRWPVARPCSLREPWAPEWRQQRPVYVSKSAPCLQACPTNDRIRECLSLVREGELERAALLWLEEQPLPGVLGRVCYAPCEEACNRAEYDQPVAIRNLERFLGDYATERGLALPRAVQQEPKNRVAVVGSGPAGLACAYHLARRGHQPTIFEALPVAGGMLRVGIPDYHLPKRILEREVGRILTLGVELQLQTAIEDLDALFDKGYEAIFLAAGAHRGLKSPVDGAQPAGVLTGVEFLRRVSLGERVRVGRSVLVVGGGNVAIDVARTALRLGAASVALACLESRDSMPAHRWEIEAAEAEGVTIYPDRAVRAIVHHGEEIVGAECSAVTFVSFSEDGNLTLETRAGSEHVLPCKTAIFAVGQVPDVDFLSKSGDVLMTSQGFISVDPVTLMTSRPGVFAGGDVIPGCGTAAEALGLGKRAASSIDAYLNGGSFAPQEMLPVAGYESLNIQYHQPSERNELPQLPPSQRTGEFGEVNYLTYGISTARAEAGRCLSCGDCSRCDNCWVFCPDMAVLKLPGSDRYRVEYTYCKGCGICAQECSCGVLEMIPEEQAEEGA